MTPDKKTAKPKSKPKPNKIARLVIPVERLRPIFIPEEIQAERATLVVVDDNGEIAKLPVPRSAFRRLMDYFTG